MISIAILNQLFLNMNFKVRRKKLNINKLLKIDLKNLKFIFINKKILIHFFVHMSSKREYLNFYFSFLKNSLFFFFFIQINTLGFTLTVTIQIFQNKFIFTRVIDVNDDLRHL